MGFVLYWFMCCVEILRCFTSHDEFYVPFLRCHNPTASQVQPQAGWEVSRTRQRRDHVDCVRIGFWLPGRCVAISTTLHMVPRFDPIGV